MQIEYNYQAVSSSAESCRQISDQMHFYDGMMTDRLDAGSEGRVKDLLRSHILQAKECVENSGALMSLTADFLQRMNSYMESQEDNIAAEIRL